ncbi:GFA family protein [Pseudomonas sp. BN414]|uniref:GFA family protein n=1 Tax=Pseudomonas sp. BN414 TaxID=2567888 RepID=UPI002455083A|nr:GFA family protein [Pseudomonas sp. BN414]MDH4566301.1 GFA family protein [Pseudomonas sp. BN414]
MNTIQGSCLCGDIKYSTHLAPLTTAVCHCSDCQKQSGSAFSVNVLVPIADFLVEGESLGCYAKAGGSGLPVKRYFCTCCGSALYSEIAAMPGVLAVKAGTLADALTTPNLHLWCASAQPWVAIDRSLPCFEHAATD